jgi:hypothetical protein
VSDLSLGHHRALFLAAGLGSSWGAIQGVGRRMWKRTIENSVGFYENQRNRFRLILLVFNKSVSESEFF